MFSEIKWFLSAAGIILLVLVLIVIFGDKDFSAPMIIIGGVACYVSGHLGGIYYQT